MIRRTAAWFAWSLWALCVALEAEDGSVFLGCNVENASYGLTICAERAAICAAVTAGARRFRRAVVVSDIHPPAAPCGACRQVLAEFGLDLPIDGVGTGGAVHWRLSQLLPEAFGPEQLR